MIFLLFMYATLLWGRPKIPANIGNQRQHTLIRFRLLIVYVPLISASPTKLSAKTRSTSASESMDESDTDSTSTHRNKRMPPAISSARRPSLLSPLGRQHHYGSFYLRMGAVGKWSKWVCFVVLRTIVRLCQRFMNAVVINFIVKSFELFVGECVCVCAGCF